jgi:hypothetical protein
MSVFDGKVKIGRAVPDPETDHSLPPGGALSFASIKSVTALSGTNGAYACLITGNKWQELNGKHTENVTMDHLLSILGNRKETITGNHTGTIVGTTNQTQVGVHNETNVSARNNTYVQPLNETHSQPHNISQPTALQRFEESVSEYFKQHWRNSLWYGTLYGMKIDLVPGLNLAYSTVKTEGGVIKTQTLLMKHKSTAMDSKLQGFVTNLFLSAILASFLQAKMIMADLNGGIAANADSPFA